jgi:hypothetical protein
VEGEIDETAKGNKDCTGVRSEQSANWTLDVQYQNCAVVYPCVYGQSAPVASHPFQAMAYRLLQVLQRKGQTLMSDGFSLDILGNKAILDNLQSFGEQMAEKAISKTVDAGYMALDLSNERAPVDTGYLKSRNQLFVNQEGSRVDVTVSNDTPYALPVILGHHTRSGSWVDPQDFLTPSFDDAGRWLEGELKGLMR